MQIDIQGEHYSYRSNTVFSLSAKLPLYEETKNVLRACAGKSNMRIGHGTFLHRYEKNSGHDEMEELVIKAKIPIGTVFFIFRLLLMN